MIFEKNSMFSGQKISFILFVEIKLNNAGFRSEKFPLKMRLELGVNRRLTCFSSLIIRSLMQVNKHSVRSVCRGGEGVVALSINFSILNQTWTNHNFYSPCSFFRFNKEENLLKSDSFFRHHQALTIERCNLLMRDERSMTLWPSTLKGFSHWNSVKGYSFQEYEVYRRRVNRHKGTTAIKAM